LQIVTIARPLAGRRLDTPPLHQDDPTVGKAPRAKAPSGGTVSLLEQE